MFGYVKIERGELRVREYEYYRATYCGLCRAMGKCTGQCSRMLLSYDFTFLAAVRMLLCEEKAQFRRRRCIAHPLRRRTMMEVSDQLRHCAVASTLLAFEKCRDNVADERGFRRLKARVQCVLLHRAYRKARKLAPALAETVRALLERLSQKEREQIPSVDAYAEIFGELLAAVCAYGLEGEQALLARKIGFETGRFIYIVDAIDDLAEDAKKKRFNPFIPLWGGALTDEAKQSLHDALIAYLCRLEEAVGLLPTEQDTTRREILNNILYLGMPATLKQVLELPGCHKEDGRE